MSAARVLLLGGTGEARELAGLLDAAGVAVTSSLAGAVAAPRLPSGDVRVGGFGGADGLAEYVREHAVAAIVDATHPYATRISEHAASAAAATGVPLLRLARPPWTERPGDRWHRVADVAAAAALVPALGRRVLLTLGRSGPAAFAGIADGWFLVRSVDPPAPPLPAHHELLLARGPFAVEDELELLETHRIDVVVTRDSGGTMTSAKLDAARHRGIPVVVIDRPPGAPAETVGDPGAAAAWVRARLTA